jgi:repressor LexA
MRLYDETLLNRIFDYIEDTQKTEGRSPSQRDITAKFRLQSSRTFRYIHLLAKRGRIWLNDDNTIAIPYGLNPNDVNHIPLVGAVQCGAPTLAMEDFDGLYKFPRALTGSGEFIMLRAKGDSMVDVGIYEGDYLIVRKQEIADSGNIVLACKISENSTDEDATLKRYLIENGQPILRAENNSYKDIDASEYRIIGTLKGLYRKM